MADQGPSNAQTDRLEGRPLAHGAADYGRWASPFQRAFGFVAWAPKHSVIHLSTEVVDKVVGNRWPQAANPREIKLSPRLLKK